MRLARWWYAPLYDGFHDHASRLYHNQCRTLCGGRFIVCIRPWRDQQSGAEKDKSCIKIVADGLIPVSRFAFKRLKSA